MRPFFAGDDPHPCRPIGEVEQPGQFGDPGAVSGLAIGVPGRGPALVGDLFDQLSRIGGQGPADRVLDPLTVQPVQDVVGAAGTVGADQNALARPAAGQAGKLCERVSHHADVVGGAAVFEPAFPGRSKIANISPVPAAP